MKYALLIQAHPLSAGNLTALEFAKSLLAAGHQIISAFFFQDGLYTALSGVEPPQDEDQINQLWQEFAEQTGTPLTCCVTSARRRGITEERLAQPFYFTGLGAFMGDVHSADRMVQFHD